MTEAEKNEQWELVNFDLSYDQQTGNPVRHLIRSWMQLIQLSVHWSQKSIGPMQ
jgi:hypothetical protein